MDKPLEILRIEQSYNVILELLPDGEDVLEDNFNNHFELDKDKNIIGLNLSGNEILEIKNFGSLDKLKKLALAGNQISEIKNLSSLKNIIYLNLSSNQIKKIKNLTLLKKLKRLDLSHNQILKIEKLDSLINLYDLNLFSNQIEEIENLDTLQNLTTLSLYGNQIKNIKNLESLKKLTFLDLSLNQIYEIKNLETLINLKELMIWGNKINQLKGLDTLSNLRTLFVSDNEITEISGLKNLSSLVSLYLHANKITNIKNLENLANLRRLDIDNNQISKIEQIETLKRLERIDFSNNIINDIYNLHPFIEKFNFCYVDKTSCDKGEINLFGNSLDDFLIKILQIEDLSERKKQLINYFDNLKQERRPLRETKLMILGEGEAGKTNLRNFILKQPFKIGKSATTGIKIDIWNQKIDDLDYRINVWDFGGQWIQQQVHQFFITNESIYIVLLNARQDEKPEKWLDWIKNYAQESLVFLVANKMDENSNFKLEENALKAEYPFIKGFSYISLFKANERVEEEIEKINNLLSDIKQKVLEIRNINTPIPANYHDLKNDLEDNYLKGKPSLSFDLFKKDLYDLHKVSGEPEDLLEILQKIGTVRFFKNFDKLILSPEWLSDGVYKILMSKLENEKHGVLTDAELEQIILTPTEECSHQYRDSDVPFIRQLMQDFKLAYFKENQCFVPSQFDKDLPEEIELTELKKESKLIFYFEFFTYFPTNIISKFIVDFFGKVDGEKYWETGIVLKDNDIDLNRETEATVISDDKARRISIFMKGDDIRPFFSEIHKNILTYLTQTKFKYKEHIFLPKYENSVNYRELILYYKKDRKDISLSNLLNDDIVDLDVKKTLGLVNNEKEIDELKKQLEESERNKIVQVDTYIETQNNFEKETTFDKNQFGGKNNKQEN